MDLNYTKTGKRRMLEIIKKRFNLNENEMKSLDTHMNETLKKTKFDVNKEQIIYYVYSLINKKTAYDLKTIKTKINYIYL